MESEELICERTLKGGLNTTVQIYRLSILPLTINVNGTVKYGRKISIKHQIADPPEKPTSLRFDNSMAALYFLKEFSKAYGRFKYRNGEIYDYGYELAQLIEEIKKGFEEGARQP